MGIKLFDDAAGVDDLEKIEINKDFAKRFEHNKKREDLQRYEEMKKKGLAIASDSDESDSDSDSDEFADLDARKDVKFFDNLVKIRKKDPILQRKDAKLFESSSDEDDDDVDDNGGARKEKRKPKPKYLKDVVARNLIEDGPEFEEENDVDDEEEKRERNEKKVKSFVEEQEELRNEVLAAMEAAERDNDSGGEGGGLLKEKERGGGNVEDEDEEEVVVKHKLDEYFGEDEKLDEKEMFLKDYFKNKMWIEKDERNVGSDDEDFGVSEDEEVLEKQEDYEREYNFRFEENKSDRVLGHSRIVEGSVRKETNARKQQRERKKERMEVAEFERREEVKRLKNLKRKEVQEKLSKIREIAGIEGEDIPLNEDDLEGDFDPEEFDRKMKKAFGDEYYQAEDVDPEFGNESDEEEGEGDLEKPDFDKEDELLGLPKDWDVIKSNSNDGFLAEREKLRSRVESENGVNGAEGRDEEDEEEEDEEQQQEEGKRKRKRKSKLKEALDKELEEELYKLDYEDTIGDLKTRFKYRQVKPDRFKLSTKEILEYDEKELNQYVSLKKLAPYRDQEWKVPQIKKQMLLGGLLNKQKKHKKRKTVDGEGPSETRKEKDTEENPSKEESKMSRKAKRRQREKEKRLPHSRLIAYGKIPASSVYNSKK